MSFQRKTAFGHLMCLDLDGCLLIDVCTMFKLTNRDLTSVRLKT